MQIDRSASRFEQVIRSFSLIFTTGEQDVGSDVEGRRVETSEFLFQLDVLCVSNLALGPKRQRARDRNGGNDGLLLDVGH